jgi:hypothetical protein
VSAGRHAARRRSRHRGPQVVDRLDRPGTPVLGDLRSHRLADTEQLSQRGFRQRALRPGPELEKARREVAEYERFRDLVRRLTEVNEAICAANSPMSFADGSLISPSKAAGG